MVYKTSFFVGFLFSQMIFICYAQFLDQKPQGWNWYLEKKKDKPGKGAARQKTTAISAFKKPAPQQVKELQKRFDEKLAVALIEPTLEHVREVQLLQRQIMARASRFEEMWMLTGLMGGESFQPQDHTNMIHRKIYEQEEERALEKHLKQLSSNYGLFFIFQEKCSYCHQFAPIVKEFADQFGFYVLAISGDRGRIPIFKTVPDNGLLLKLNPQKKYPALFLVRFDGGKFIPLSWGLVSLSDLKTNAKMVLRFLSQEEKRE